MVTAVPDTGITYPVFLTQQPLSTLCSTRALKHTAMHPPLCPVATSHLICVSLWFQLSRKLVLALPVEGEPPLQGMVPEYGDHFWLGG